MDRLTPSSCSSVRMEKMYSYESYYSNSSVETDNSYESHASVSIQEREDSSYETSPSCTGSETEESNSNSSVSSIVELSRYAGNKRLKKAKDQEETVPYWTGIGVFMTIVLVFSIILQPTAIEDPPLISELSFY